jgi:hypothetical protein
VQERHVVLHGIPNTPMIDRIAAMDQQVAEGDDQARISASGSSIPS